MVKILGDPVLGWWGLADYWAHRLWLPRRIRYWFCDRYDNYLGA